VSIGPRASDKSYWCAAFERCSGHNEDRATICSDSRASFTDITAYDVAARAIVDMELPGIHI
jgi:hypothetical protein